MKPRACFRFAVALIAWLGGVAAVRAHGPFDSSVLVTLGETQMEVAVVLGTDAALKFFAAHRPGAPLPQPVGRGLVLPGELVGKLFQLTAGETELAPREFRAFTDGLEYRFVAVYPAPEAGPWRFRAHYFALDERIAPGVFDVISETGDRLGREVLSRSITTAHFGGAAPAGVSPASSDVSHVPTRAEEGSGVSNATASTTSVIVVTNQYWPAPDPASQKLRLWLLLAVVFLLGLAGAWALTCLRR